MSKTSLKPNIKRELWYRAHGRCEFNGCNKRLDLHGVTFDTCNLSNAAHIIGDSSNGPRGDKELSSKLAADINNLMLMCPECHKYIDHEGKDKYDVETLRRMKKEHEDRIEMLADIAPNRKSLVVFCGPKIGHDEPVLNKNDAFEAILPDYYPSEPDPVRIEMKDCVLDDTQKIYWKVQTQQLETRCKEEVLRKAVKTNHISLFALGPQPLLVKLGTLLGDIHEVDVFQKHREPSSWKWQDTETENHINVIPPKDTNKTPVLVFALSSANIISRVERRFGDSASIWVVSCETPGNDMLKSKEQLEEFRTKVRAVLDTINANAEGKDLHVFMAMPVACAVEFGRVRMKKADIPWVLYDYQRCSETDIETFKIE